MQLTGTVFVCVCVFVTVCVSAYAFRAASLHGPGHDTRGLHALLCDHRQRDAAFGRGLELALRGQLELLQLPGNLVVLHDDVCRPRFFPPHMYFAGLTRINNKQNIQGKGPDWSGGTEEPTILGKLGLL